jgi:N-acetylglucosaminyl-diphospho-decaprenol L-rhamnosyltransferase
LPATDARSWPPTVVIATRDRRERLLATLARIAELPERPPIVVVDNASRDGTSAAVARRHPGVELIVLARDAGSAARTVGVEAAPTSLVAFSDDDSWWEPGALGRAAERFAERPRLGLIAARIVVEPDGRVDPTCALMRDSPLPAEPGLPGPAVLGFLACGAVARREAVLACGGFHARFGFGGEETLLALDMASAGWELAYVEDVVAHHAPERGPRGDRTVRELRNALWATWLRRRLPRAAVATLALAAGGPPAGLREALRGLPWVLRERRPISSELERRIRLLDPVS